MDSSDDSPLSSAPESDSELLLTTPAKATKPSPVQRKRKRSPSPPRQPTLADSPEIAFIVMFQNRFAEVMKGVPHLGCQDIEQGIISIAPSEKIELLLCRLVSLILNRKKPVERGHHQRALEEALQANHSQWPKSWGGQSPFTGGKTFSELEIPQKLDLLKILINWTLYSSEAVRAILNTHYKPSRKSGDPNNPLAVHVWGQDGLQRRYYLIEGKDDTLFRVYRENPAHLKTVQWQSVASNFSELHALAAKMDLDGSLAARTFRARILAEIPRLEEGERKRQRREYRLSRKMAFSAPAIYSYEGRTRGKRMKYTYSSDEDTEGTRSRRSLRSRRESPEESSGPTFTASGRQIRKPVTGAYGESITNGRGYADGPNGLTADVVVSDGKVNGRPSYNYDDSGDDDVPSNYGDEKEDDYHATDADDESEEVSDGDDESFDGGETPRALVVRIVVPKEKLAAIWSPKKPEVNGDASKEATDPQPKSPTPNNAEGPESATTDEGEHATPFTASDILAEKEAPPKEQSKPDVQSDESRERDVDMDQPLEHLPVSDQRTSITVT